MYESYFKYYFKYKLGDVQAKCCGFIYRAEARKIRALTRVHLHNFWPKKGTGRSVFRLWGSRPKESRLPDLQSPLCDYCALCLGPKNGTYSSKYSRALVVQQSVEMTNCCCVLQNPNTAVYGLQFMCTTWDPVEAEGRVFACCRCCCCCCC